MDPGVPQDALIQVSHALCRCIPRLGLQHLPTPQDLWGGALRRARPQREVPEQAGQD